MHVFLSRLGLIAVSVAVFSSLALAQWRTGSSTVSALSPSTPAPGGENVFSPDHASVFVSAFVGINHNTNDGKFRTDCDCEFDGAFNLGNIGAQVGVDVTYQFSNNWAVIAKAYYDNKHTKEAYERPIVTPIVAQQQVIIREVQYEESGTVGLSYATFGLFGRWQPRLERWYVYVGPSVGYPLAKSIDHLQTIVTPELSYRDGGITDNQRKVSEDPASFDGLVRVEAMLGFGYDYIFRPRWFINPEIRFGFPLTKITDSVSDRGKNIPIPDWKVMSLELSIGIKYEAF